MKPVGVVSVVILFFFVWLSPPPAHGQNAPAKRWDKTFGVSGASTTLTRIRQASDGGILVAGYTNGGAGNDKTDSSRGASDFWFLKLDTLGQLGWQKTIGGSYDDDLMDIAETPDQGWILAGTSSSDSNGDKKSHNIYLDDYWLVRLGANGTILWDSTYGGFDYDQLAAVVAVRSGGFLMAGSSSSDPSGSKTSKRIGGSDYWIVRVDNNGNKLWDRDFGGTSEDRLTAAVQTSDGDFLLGGSSNSDSSGTKHQSSNGVYKFWVVKTDSLGNYIWERTYGDTTSSLTSVTEASDGGFLLGGSFGRDVGIGDGQYWVVKINRDGDSLWSRSYWGGDGSGLLESVCATADGGFLLAGSSTADSGNDKSEHYRSNGFPPRLADYWVIKIDSLGVKEWDKTLGGTNNEICASVIQTRDGGFVIGGISSSDSSGDKSENCRTPNNGGDDFWVVALGPEGEASVRAPSISKNLTVYPDPATSVAHVSLDGLTASALVTLDDAMGRRVFSSTPLSARTLDLDLHAYPAGIYYMRLFSGEKVYAAKVVKE